MRVLPWLLFCPALLWASSLSGEEPLRCYTATFSPPEDAVGIIPSNTSRCILMFKSRGGCDVNTAKGLSVPILRAEPSLFEKPTGCWQPYETDIWCYCDKDLCNDPQAEWWQKKLEEYQVPEGDFSLRYETQQCAISYAHSFKNREPVNVSSSVTSATPTESTSSGQALFSLSVGLLSLFLSL